MESYVVLFPSSFFRLIVTPVRTCCMGCKQITSPMETSFHSCLLSVVITPYFVSNVRRICMHEWQANHGQSGTIEAAGTTHTPEGNRASPTHTCSIKDLNDLTAYMHLHWSIWAYARTWHTLHMSFTTRTITLLNPKIISNRCEHLHQVKDFNSCDIFHHEKN